MKEQKFAWGPVARGIYIGMLWFTVVIGWHFPNMLTYYIPLLVFLGLGLRPLLERTGLYDLYVHVIVKIDDKKWEKINEKKRIEIARKERDKKYKASRTRDPKLPENW